MIGAVLVSPSERKPLPPENSGGSPERRKIDSKKASKIGAAQYDPGLPNYVWQYLWRAIAPQF